MKPIKESMPMMHKDQVYHTHHAWLDYTIPRLSWKGILVMLVGC